VEDACRSVIPAPLKPDPAQWSDNRVTLCWLGHATVLVNFYGLNILTDPAFGNRVGVSLGLGTIGPKRYIAPALRAHELTRIDVVLLSHAHMDHLDLPSLQRLPRGMPVVSAKVTRDLLARTQQTNITELAWNESTTVRTTRGDLFIQAFEVKHWGQRWPSELARGYNGYLFRREDKTLLFGGDTALTPLFKDLKGKGLFEAAIMPIGAYQPWIWNHCTPEQAVKMAEMAGARYIVPVHHQTFRLSDEPMNEPIERLQVALEHESDRLALKQVGEAFVLPKV
jgi:L-ascorbate metabolism protein UlaG (beta-lactamase superfamily)